MTYTTYTATQTALAQAFMDAYASELQRDDRAGYGQDSGYEVQGDADIDAPACQMSDPFEQMAQEELDAGYWASEEPTWVHDGNEWVKSHISDLDAVSQCANYNVEKLGRWSANPQSAQDKAESSVRMLTATGKGARDDRLYKYDGVKAEHAAKLIDIDIRKTGIVSRQQKRQLARAAKANRIQALKQNLEG